MARDGKANQRQPQPMASSSPWGRHGSLVSLLGLLISAAVVTLGSAQTSPHHYFQRADLPPGAIGSAQLMRGGPLPGHYQAVEIAGPEGVRIALANQGFFEEPVPAPLKAGLLVGHVYRLKVTSIPLREGQELFPSVEIINRLYPPQGSQARFPIPIELTRQELEMALRGQFVIRVIYLENPRTALPQQEDPAQQRYFDVGPGQDPLEVADGLGRPMAILRIGSRVPELDQISGRFLFHCPPWIRYPEMIDEAPTEVPQPADTDQQTRSGQIPVPPAAAQRPETARGVYR
jgi:hypothetical protein